MGERHYDGLVQKDFEGWHTRKSSIHSSGVRPNFHAREVWFISMGVNIGFEQDGKGSDYLRPVLVVRKFDKETFWGVALTSRSKSGVHYFTFSHRGGGRLSTANLSQLKLIDSKRLRYQVGAISEDNFIELKKRLIDLLV